MRKCSNYLIQWYIFKWKPPKYRSWLWFNRIRPVPMMLVAAGVMVASGPSLATEQAQQRQDARDVRQDTRPDARGAKVDCRTADQKNNPECRQDKRDTKQEGRESARDARR
jgi:hypothetical protein